MSSIQVAMVAMAFKKAHEREGCHNCTKSEKRVGHFGNGDLWCTPGGFWVGRLAVCKEHQATAPATNTKVPA